MDLLVVLLVCLVGIILWKKWQNGIKNLPPGPINWFGVGGILAVRRADPKYPHVAFAKLAKKYGDIMYIKLGVNPTVVISNYEDIVNIFSKDEFQARYELPFSRDRAFNQRLGLLLNSHEPWWEVRKFSDKKLRDFGFKSSRVLKSIILEELADFKDTIRSKLENGTEGILNAQNIFAISVVNILWNIVFGFRSKECTSLLKRFLKSNEDLMTIFAHANINQVFPFLGKIFPNWTGRNRHMKIFNIEKEIFYELIAESERRHSKGNEAFNFVEAFQHQIQKEKDNPKSSFSDQQMVVTLIDLFDAGSETTSHFLEFSLLHLLRNPVIQQKIRDEIKSVVPEDEEPTYDFANSMPYTQAFMYEIFRFCNIVPIPLPHEAGVDYTYKGFLIPKGTCVMYNLHTVFNDLKYWADPEIFRPERFLDPVMGKLVKTERISVFGFGKRVCIGDILAKQTAFAYLTGLIKQFSFHPVPGEQLPSIVPKSSFVSKPQQFNVVIKSIN